MVETTLTRRRTVVEQMMEVIGSLNGDFTRRDIIGALPHLNPVTVGGEFNFLSRRFEVVGKRGTALVYRVKSAQ